MDNIWAESFSEIRELSLQEKKEEKKEGKPKRWWDDDGDGIGYEKGEVSGKFKRKVKKEEAEIEEGMKQARKNVGASTCWKGYKAKGTKKKDGKEVPNCVPEERDLSSKKNSGEKIDVMRGKNKIEINPKLSEEVEAWVGELLDEGYDLSSFTPDEIVDIYESAEVEELDEQEQDPMAAAKSRAARAKVAKEKADFQVAQQAQRLKVNPAESVIAFVEGRDDLFEGVFDPKRTKMRSASERTKSSMTDAERKSAKKEAERVAKIHSKGETVLAGLRPSGKKGKVQTTPSPKSKAPEANRRVKGKQDRLAAAADKIMKDLRK